MIFKNLLLLMIDRDTVNMELIQPIFPMISMQDPASVIQYINLVRLMAHLDYSMVRRGLTYAPMVFLIYTG